MEKNPKKNTYVYIKLNLFAVPWKQYNFLHELYFNVKTG